MSNTKKRWADSFQPGAEYTRSDVQDVLGIPTRLRGGNWSTGYHRAGDTFFIFANVGTAGRTGHDYENQWSTLGLEWQGRTGSRLRHPNVRRLLAAGTEVLLFARGGDRSVFTFMGPVTPGHFEDIGDDGPIYVEWVLSDPNYLTFAPEADPDLVNLRPSIRPSVRADVLVRDRVCRLCLRPVDVLEDAGCWLEVDHIIPVTKGGTSEPDNLQALCNECNGGKSNRYTTDHRRAGEPR